MPLQKVIVRNIEEPIERAVYLEQGEIDLAWDLQPAESHAPGDGTGHSSL